MTVSQQDPEQFIYHEAALLDNREFEAWLELFADDAIYWIPNWDANGDPNDDGVIVYEDRTGLRARVARLLHPLNPTQVPVPRTRHFITNVVPASGEHGEVTVSSNQVVYVSQAGQQHQFAGACHHILRPGENGWRIKHKQVSLLANDAPLTQIPVL
jgi:3-phenylpropionate/cinnamic acid dioxygenase small subunit